MPRFILDTPSKWIKPAPLTLRLAGALKQSLGEPNVVEMPSKMTSEDFAEYGVARRGIGAASHRRRQSSEAR